MNEQERKEKIEKLVGMDGEKLADAYKWYVKNFNPLNFDRCDEFELVKAEIMKRLKRKY